jgi:hypothetical protein
MKILKNIIRPFWGMCLLVYMTAVLHPSCSPHWKNGSPRASATDTIQKAAALKALTAFAQAENLKVPQPQLQQLLDLVDHNLDFSKRMLLSTQEVIDSNNIIAIAQQLKLPENPAKASLSLYQTRVWYSWQKSLIGKQVDRSKGLEQAARNAFNRRNAIRTQARFLMRDTDIAHFLNQKEVNLTWKEVFKRNKGDYEAIIASAMRGRAAVDVLFRIPK